MERSIKKTLKRTVCAGMLIVLLGMASWKAAKEALSNFYLEFARHGIARAAAIDPRLQAEALISVTQHFIESLHYSPGNPWTLEDLAALQMRRMREPKESRIPVAMAVRSANENYHKALVQRPVAPVAWANLALTYLYVSGKDDALSAALRYADELGPWDAEVQQLVVLVSLASWDRLGSAQQAATLRTMERAAQRDGQKVTQLVESFQRADLLCGINNDKLKAHKACSR
jgi:hypothetical protein